MRSWSCQRMQSPIGRRLCGSIAHDGVAAGQHFGDGALDDHDAADVPGRSGAGAAGLTDIAATWVVPEFLRTLVFARPRGDDQFADCTFSPSLDMSR